MRFLMYLMLLKSAPEQLMSRNFSSSEFICKCKNDSCNFSMMYQRTIDSLQRFRDYQGAPLRINSAHRCQLHNHAVGGGKNSYHMKGHAVDIAVPEDEDIEQFASEAEMFFDVVIIYSDENFIHCHNL